MTGSASDRSAASLLARVDHLVYAVPDVDAAVDELERRLGVRASIGGRHLGKGTRNCLLALGPRSYLEIVGPDREQPEPAKPRWFGIDSLTAPRLATWAAQTPDLDAAVACAAAAGFDLGAVLTGGRQKGDGTTVSWRVSDVRRERGGGVVPFLIDWGASEHPAVSAAPGVTLVGLSAEHPDPVALRPALAPLGLDLEIRFAPSPALVATLDTPRGRVELR